MFSDQLCWQSFLTKTVIFYQSHPKSLRRINQSLGLSPLSWSMKASICTKFETKTFTHRFDHNVRAKTPRSCQLRYLALDTEQGVSNKERTSPYYSSIFIIASASLSIISATWSSFQQVWLSFQLKVWLSFQLHILIIISAILIIIFAWSLIIISATFQGTICHQRRLTSGTLSLPLWSSLLSLETRPFSGLSFVSIFHNDVWMAVDITRLIKVACQW